MIPRKAVTALLVALFINITIAHNSIFSAGIYNPIDDVQVECNSNDIVITIRDTDDFNGLIYPKGLSKNSSCMAEYTEVNGNITYSVPLHSCNTMSNDVTDGVEYFNTVVVQPHRRLVTNQGRGIHIRCRYHTKDKIVQNDGVNISDLHAVPYNVEADIPASVMKIYVGEDNRQLHQAENVRIGDELRMTIVIDQQATYGMKVTNCVVRDGLNWGEQQLINHEGCSVDRELMGELEYSANKTMATVRFQAHKFPYTSSVYYQCTVQLCVKDAISCEEVPPLCTSDGRNLRRRKRQVQTTTVMDITEDGKASESDDLSSSVYSGFYVNDPHEEPGDEISPEAEKAEEDQAFCISARLFAIIIAIVGLILMAAVILLVVCLIQRRRRRKDLSTTAGSSIYSGPYSNHAYSST